MTTDDEKLDAAVVAGLYVQHAVNLERFLVGVLGDRDQAKDVLQVAFARLIEQGHRVCVDSQKAWLYQVAYREALAARRRDARTARILPMVARMRAKSELTPETTLLRREAVEAVRQALSELPSEQAELVRLRIYAGKTFAVIAEDLRIPLGTALGRMRAAMSKLRTALRELDE